jgi:integrase
MARAHNKLTSVAIANLNVRGLYADGGGLWLQVSKWGTKAWIFRYMLNGKRHLMGLGPLHSVSLAEARTRARQHRQIILDGFDPLQTKAEARARYEADKAARLARENALTFRGAAELFLKTTAVTKLKNDKHRKQWRTTLEEVFPVLGDMPLQEIDSAKVLEAIAPIMDRAPETGARTRSRIARVFSWAAPLGHFIGENPAGRDVLKDHLGKKPKPKHHKAYPFKGLPAFMAELRNRESMSARAMEFTILTATRTSETIGATWDEIDLDAKTWTIPADRMKAKIEHVVPLSERAVEILKGVAQKVPPSGANSATIFGNGKPLSNMAMLELLKGMAGNGYTVHGFRSSFRDWAGDQTSHAHEVIEFALAHGIPNKASAAYRRYRAIEKRRELMSEWAAYCCQ